MVAFRDSVRFASGMHSKKLGSEQVQFRTSSIAVELRDVQCGGTHHGSCDHGLMWMRLRGEPGDLRLPEHSSSLHFPVQRVFASLLKFSAVMGSSESSNENVYVARGSCGGFVRSLAPERGPPMNADKFLIQPRQELSDTSD